MTAFGDHDPEDAYDATDPPHVRLDNLHARLDPIADHLRAHPGHHARLERVRADLRTLIAELKHG